MAIRGIDYFLEDPNRLLYAKPFFRGGELMMQDEDKTVLANQSVKDVLTTMRLKPITQDVYECEYFPHLHKILSNMSFPRIAVKIGDKQTILEEQDMVITLPYQKAIHTIHVLHSAMNKMEFTLLNNEASDSILSDFTEIKQRWASENMEYIKYLCVSRQLRVGDVGLLFRYDKAKNKANAIVMSHVEGKHIIPNYNEYGELISTSIHYITDEGDEYIDTYDDLFFYRHRKAKDKKDSINASGWIRIGKREIHGFSRCPLLYKRGYVAWEFVQSPIEMLELIYNLYATIERRFGTFAIWINGKLEEDDLKAGENVLIINQQDPNDKGDMKVIEFPKPEGIIELINSLKEQIEMGGSVTFLSPDRIKSSGDAASGTAIMLTMKNDLALAKQRVEEWAEFTDNMFYLFCESQSLVDSDITKFTKLKTRSRLSVWTPEATSTLISNLVQLKSTGAISQQTLTEIAPYIAPDEMKRLQKQFDEATKTIASQTPDETIVVDKITN